MIKDIDISQLTLTSLGEQIQHVIEESMKVAVKVGEQLAKSGTSKHGTWKNRTGKLQASISGEAFGLTGVIKADAKYASFLEEGTKPRTITPKRIGGKLNFFWENQNAWVSLSRVKHPGNKALFFVLDAAEAAGEVLQKDIESGLERVLGRFNR